MKDIAANLQRQIDLLKVATGSKITDSTAAAIGVAQDTTVDAAINTIGISVKLLKDESGYISLIVKDSSGAPITGIKFSNVKDASGNSVATDENGIASGYIPKGSQTIEIQGYVDISDYSETIEIVSGNIYTKEIIVTDAASEILYETSKNIQFSQRISDFDICAVGGGGGGGGGGQASSGDATAGAGGGGGYATNQLNIKALNDTIMQITIGAGGSAGSGRSNSGTGYKGGKGGATKVVYGDIINITVNGGNGGGPGYGSGNLSTPGTGNGDGGRGSRYGDGTDNTHGGNGTVYKFGEQANGLAGGGGGDGGDGNGDAISGDPAAPYGGKQGAGGKPASGYHYKGGDGRGIGGGGAGGDLGTHGDEGSCSGGKGYHGGVYIRWRKKT